MQRPAEADAVRTVSRGQGIACRDPLIFVRKVCAVPTSALMPESERGVVRFSIDAPVRSESERDCGRDCWRWPSSHFSEYESELKYQS